MKKIVKSLDLHQESLKFLLIIVLVIGVFFRFVNLDRKVYWTDEAYSSLRISGYTEAELIEQISYDRILSAEDLQKYQRPAPEKNLADVVKSLAVEEPQHPPLYFLIARLWTEWFGSSVTITRSLSALISLLVFPCIYWLCQELFDSPLVGWVAIALVAVSPLQVLYAQEVREYVLWIVAILLSSASLLRTLRLQTALNWVGYAATLVIGLYTFPFSGIVMLCHGIYTLAMERFRLNKTVTAYIIASLFALLCFVPWAWATISGLPQVARTAGFQKLTDALSPISIIRVILGNIRLTFFDLNAAGNYPNFLYKSSIYLFVNLAILVMLCYSIYLLYSRTSKQVWLFILTLLGISGLIIIGLQRPHLPRFSLPSYLAIQLAVAYLLATQISLFSVNKWQQRLWQIIMMVTLAGGIVSCMVISQAQTWWIKGSNSYTPQIAQVINQAASPLVISDVSPGDVLSLSHYLAAKVRLQIEPQCYTCPVASTLASRKTSIPEIPDSFSDLFLFQPSNELREGLEKKYKLQPIDEFGNLQGYLWRLTKL